MSDDALTTPTALESSEAAPEGAPPVTTEVEGGSAGAGVVPADRFNGLMSSYNKYKDETESRIRAMTAELESLRQTNQETTQVTDTSGLEAEVAALRDALIARDTRDAKERVLAEFPEAKVFADLIVGDSEEDLRAVASQLSERVKLLTTGEPAPVVEADTETAPASEVDPAGSAGEVEAPGMPEHGGGASVSPATAALDDAVEQAIQAGDFDAFLEAQWARQADTAAV